MPSVPQHRILHLITTFPLSSGAAENTKLTLNGLDRRRFQPMVAFGRTHTMVDELAPDIEQIPLRWLRREPDPIRDPAALFEIVSTIRRLKADLVHTHNAKDGILGRWAAWMCGIPAVHTIHNVSFEASSNPIVRTSYAMLERLTAPITARILAVSRHNITRYLSRGIGTPNQYQTIYSGLELSLYGADSRSSAAIRAAVGLPHRPGPWVGWFGRFNTQKDPATFVRAAAIVRQRVPEVQFLVCGDAPLGNSQEQTTMDLAQDLGLRDCMHFLGFRRDLPLLLQAVDVVMHSSIYEGMGRVICEALATRRPVAATAVDGVLEVVESGVRGGILAPPRSPELLAAAAVVLLSDGQLAANLATAGHDWVTDHLSVTTMVQAIEDTYEAILAPTTDNLRHTRRAVLH